MLKKFIQTEDSFTGLIARIALGIVILPHGLQKLVGLFGGSGFSATMNIFTNTMGFPAILAFLIIVGESFGALALILGFLARFNALAINVIMLGAIFLAHLPNGFFMNWYGSQTGEGFEYHLLALGLGFVTVVTGAGKWSVDLWLADRFRSESRDDVTRFQKDRDISQVTA